LSFTLWSNVYHDPLFFYGYDGLRASVFWPAPLFAHHGFASNNLFDIYGYGPTGAGQQYFANYGRHHHHHRHYAPYGDRGAPSQTRAAELAAEAGAYGGLVPGAASLPIDEIENALHPTDAQIMLLNDLRSASTWADNVLRSSCAQQIPLTPVERLDAMQKRLQAIEQAVLMLKDSLAKFNVSLDPQQKGSFAEIGTPRNRTARRDAKANALGSLCNSGTQILRIHQRNASRK